MCSLPKTALLFLLSALAATPAPTAPGRTNEIPRRDLADEAQGSYLGDVISDARGSSRSGVRITVAKVGPNRIKVTSDYARLPAFTVPLTKAMATIQNASGDHVFLLDLSKQPRTLNVTVDDASWAGTRD